MLMSKTLSLLLLTTLAGASAGLTSGKLLPQGGDAPVADTSSSVTLLRGLDVPVRSREESDITEDTRTVSYEAYYDWDFGAVTLVSETGDIDTIPHPGNWDLRTAFSAENELVSLCFRPSTGIAYVLDEDQKWVQVKEAKADELPTLGQYDIVLSVNQSNEMAAIRFESLSGRSWRLTSGGWKPIEGNLAGWPAK